MTLEDYNKIWKNKIGRELSSEEFKRFTDKYPEKSYKLQERFALIARYYNATGESIDKWVF